MFQVIEKLLQILKGTPSTIFGPVILIKKFHNNCFTVILLANLKHFCLNLERAPTLAGPWLIFAF